jgi:hypothetical protein
MIYISGFPRPAWGTSEVSLLLLLSLLTSYCKSIKHTEKSTLFLAFQSSPKGSKMDVTQANASPSRVNFMPSSPPPEEQGIKPWPEDLEFDFIKYLESDESTNQSVLTSTKRTTI